MVTCLTHRDTVGGGGGGGGEGGVRELKHNSTLSAMLDSIRQQLTAKISRHWLRICHLMLMLISCVNILMLMLISCVNILMLISCVNILMLMLISCVNILMLISCVNILILMLISCVNILMLISCVNILMLMLISRVNILMLTLISCVNIPMHMLAFILLVYLIKLFISLPGLTAEYWPVMPRSSKSLGLPSLLNTTKTDRNLEKTSPRATYGLLS